MTSWLLYIIAYFSPHLSNRLSIVITLWSVVATKGSFQTPVPKDVLALQIRKPTSELQDFGTAKRGLKLSYKTAAIRFPQIPHTL